MDEHLRLFAGIKGVPEADVEATITELIADVGLEVSALAMRGRGARPHVCTRAMREPSRGGGA